MLGQDLTLRPLIAGARFIGRPTDAGATSRPSSARPTGSTSRRSTTSRSRSSGSACFANLSYELADDINFSVKGVWNQRKSKNQAAPLPFGRRARRRPNAGARRASSIDATNPFNPFGVDRWAIRTQRTTATAHLPPLRRGRAAPLQPDGRHLLRRRRRSTASSTSAASDWFWDVNAAYGRNKAKQTMFGNINAGQLAPGAGPGRRLHRALRAVQHLRRRRIDHPGDDRLCRASSQNDSSEQKLLDVDRQPVRQPVRAAGRAAGPRRRRRISRAQGPVRSRSGRRRGLQLRHSGAADQGQLRRQGSLCRAERAAAGATCRSSTCSS